jgi:hypothetical protein
MKRIMGITLMLILIATAAHAGVIGTVKGWFSAFSWQAAGYILTGLLGVGVLATKREWVSAILIAIANCVIGLAEAFKAAGLALADGKVDGDELKGIWKEMTDVPTLFREVITVFKGKGNG